MLDRQFQADELNRKWVADFTYVWTVEGWLCLVGLAFRLAGRHRHGRPHTVCDRMAKAKKVPVQL